ncbi:MAG: queuosine precursor transporter [Methanosphaera sp.]|uniref:queuosine precursor transporter n=2 Tax=Methanosphaera sp. TaxID=2666342 RepID=UPI002A81A9D9|nr:queuosine precursor transporter [Methanosphaera sp.]MCI5866591.1 queuosine precursor transporter [Methanosphaera sp.]MDY3955502.1 queuosine precursor transporter [Methanosphaera sp.]
MELIEGMILSSYFKMSHIAKYIFLSVIFTVAFITANVLVVKIIDLHLFNITIPAGILIYPLVFIITNVITEIYGERVAQRTLLIGMAANIIFVFFTTLVIFLPGNIDVIADESLAYIFGHTPRLFIAGCVGYFIGNLINAHLTAILSQKDNINSSFRSLIPIAVGIFVDIICFIATAYIGEIEILTIINMIVIYWIFNMLWIFIAKPFIKPILRWAKYDDFSGEII